MNNIEKYNAVFKKVFTISEDLLNDDLNVLSFEAWDSVAQMQLIAGLEEEFGVFLDPEDVVNFVSYRNGKEILLKHDVQI